MVIQFRKHYTCQRQRSCIVYTILRCNSRNVHARSHARIRANFEMYYKRGKFATRAFRRDEIFALRLASTIAASSLTYLLVQHKKGYLVRLLDNNILVSYLLYAKYDSTII